MRSNRINYAVVGLFVLVVLGGLIAAISLLTGRTGATDSYFAMYDNVGGLKFGTSVTYEGYQIGQVEAIEPVQTDSGLAFKVELAVDDGFSIPEDSTAAIASSGLLAGASIEIAGGRAARALEPGARIASGASADVFAAVSKIATQVNRLSENGLQPLLDKLNLYADDLGQTLSERMPRLLDDLKAATGALAETMPRVAADVETASTRVNEDFLGPDNLKRVESTLANLESASRSLDSDVLGEANRGHVAGSLANLERVSAEFLKMTREIEGTKRRIDAMIGKLDTAIEKNGGKLSESLSDLRYTLGVISQHVDAIAYNLEGTSRNMNEFSREIRQNPGVLLGGTSRAQEPR